MSLDDSFNGVNSFKGNSVAAVNIEYVSRLETVNEFSARIHNLNNTITLFGVVALIEPCDLLSADYIESLKNAFMKSTRTALGILELTRVVRANPVKLSDDDVYYGFFAKSSEMINDLKSSLSIFDGLSKINVSNDDVDSLTKAYSLSINTLNDLLTPESSLGLVKTKAYVSVALNNAVKAVRALAKDSNVELVTDCKRDVEIFASHDGLFEVWDNFLKNAIEHTYNRFKGFSGGKVIARVYESSNDSSCYVEIEDNGEGIKDIEKFGSRGYTTKAKGNGFGVHSSIKIIDSNNGAFGVETMPYEYTKLSVNFPLDY